MNSLASSSRHLAVLGASPAFSPGDPVPLIKTQGNRPDGDFTAVDMILANNANEDSKGRASQQRFVAKILPGVESPGLSFRAMLQDRLGELLDPHRKLSVICVSSGTNALRAALKCVRAGVATDRNEIIVPQTTVEATIEAVIAENFVPIFVGIDSRSWLLSPELAERSISERTAAIITVDWLGTQCDLRPFRKLVNKHGIKLISDSAQSFGATNDRPPLVHLADCTIYSLGYPKVLTGGGSGQRPNQLHDLHWLINLVYYTQLNQLNQDNPD